MRKTRADRRYLAKVHSKRRHKRYLNVMYPDLTFNQLDKWWQIQGRWRKNNISCNCFMCRPWKYKGYTEKTYD